MNLNNLFIFNKFLIRKNFIYKISFNLKQTSIKYISLYFIFLSGIIIEIQNQNKGNIFSKNDTFLPS